jgi:hypothetical protein
MMHQRPASLGVDLDNTLVCYDQLCWRLAVERGWIAADIPPRKTAVRNELRRLGREPNWTALQGEIYGPLMTEAVPFPGALDAFRDCHAQGLPVCIVSHRTPTPIAGPAYDMHAAARAWLEQWGFLDSRSSGLTNDRVYLEPTKIGKLACIAHVGCRWFVDDLPELLLEPTFPAGVRRILFSPHGDHPDLPPEVSIATDWLNVAERVLAEART